jgi:hypothetical protein
LTAEDWRVRLGRDHKIKEIVMAKVIEFYIPTNFRKPSELLSHNPVGSSSFTRRQRNLPSWNRVSN